MISSSVIPQKMAEYVKTSRRVIVVLSPSVLQTDYCDLSLTTALTDRIPLIFIEPPHLSTTDKQELNSLIGDNQELSAAHRVRYTRSYLCYCSMLTISALTDFSVHCRSTASTLCT